MDKKKYIVPEETILELKYQSTLLAGSPTMDEEEQPEQGGGGGGMIP